MKTIYLSGKITGTDDYAIRFSSVEQKLKEQGFEVLNPVKLELFIAKVLQYNIMYEV